MKKGSQRLAKLLLSFLAILVLIGVISRLMPGVLREGFQQTYTTCKNAGKDCKDDETCQVETICKKLVCTNGLVPKKNFCRLPDYCEKDSECASGLRCNKNSCLAEGKCKVDSNCRLGFICKNGTCEKYALKKEECVTNDDCKGIKKGPRNNIQTICRIFPSIRQFGTCEIPN